MAIFEKTIRNKNFDKLLRKLEQEIPDSSWSAASKSADQLLSGISCSSFRSSLSKFLFRMVFSKIAIMVPPF